MNEDIKEILILSFGALMFTFTITVFVIAIGWMIALGTEDTDYHNIKDLCNEIERELVYSPSELTIKCIENEENR